LIEGGMIVSAASPEHNWHLLYWYIQ